MKKPILIVLAVVILVSTGAFAAFAASGPSEAVIQARAAVTLAQNDVEAAERAVAAARAAVDPARIREREAIAASSAHEAECRATYRRTQAIHPAWGPSGDADRTRLRAAERAHFACQEEQNRLGREAALARTGVRSATGAVAANERILRERRIRLERAQAALAALEAAE